MPFNKILACARTTRLVLGAALVSTACAGAPRGAPSEAHLVRTEQTSGTSALLIAVSPVNDRVAWVSGSNGTWLRTTDGGDTWEHGVVRGADTLQFRSVHAIDARTAYLLSIGNGSQSRIYKTTDAGASWTQQFTNPDSAGFYDCLDFWDANRGVAIGDAIGGDLAILTTDDGGAHWTRVPPTSLPAAQPQEGSFAASGTCVETQSGGRAWIVMSNPAHGRVVSTSDYGRTWRVDTLPITTRSGTGPESISFRDARHGVALGGGMTAKAGDMFSAITSDGGRTWTLRASPPIRTGAWGGTYVPGANPSTIVAVGPAGAAYSRDEAATWVAIDTLDYWSVGFASPRAGWAVGTKGKITRLSGF